MAALSYYPPKLHLFREMGASSLLCVQSYIQKWQEYYFAVLIYKSLVYVNDKGEESFYYNIKMCWIWLKCIKIRIKLICECILRCFSFDSCWYSLSCMPLSAHTYYVALMWLLWGHRFLSPVEILQDIENTVIHMYVQGTWWFSSFVISQLNYILQDNSSF